MTDELNDAIAEVKKMTKQEYFAARIQLPLEGIAINVAEELMGEKLPNGINSSLRERLIWWANAEAKYRYFHANAMMEDRNK